MVKLLIRQTKKQGYYQLSREMATGLKAFKELTIFSPSGVGIVPTSDVGKRSGMIVGSVKMPLAVNSCR